MVLNNLESRSNLFITTADHKNIKQISFNSQTSIIVYQNKAIFGNNLTFHISEECENIDRPKCLFRRVLKTGLKRTTLDYAELSFSVYDKTGTE